MAVITMTIDDDLLNSSVYPAYNATYGYQATVNGQANPLSQSDFFLYQIKQFIINTTAKQSSIAAAQTAAQQAQTAALAALSGITVTSD